VPSLPVPDGHGGFPKKTRQGDTNDDDDDEVEVEAAKHTYACSKLSRARSQRSMVGVGG